MMYALVNGLRDEASPGVTGARCPSCDSAVIPKCGQIVVWHWAHVVGAECDDWAEPDDSWHRGWQSLVPPERREVVMGPHRADMVTAAGTVVELQNSNLSVPEIQAREVFYGPAMAWIFNAQDAHEWDRLIIYPKDDYVTFRWKHPRKSVSACRRRVFLDIGDGNLLSLQKIYPTAPSGGWGRIVNKRTLIAQFNDGDPVAGIMAHVGDFIDGEVGA